MVDQNVLRAVAAEHAKGKRLYIGTTNLDSQRFMIWDMGAIASSGQPDALKLFRTVMMASTSIPGVFPPVYFDVEVDGKKYNEMHVDGSIVTGVLGYGSSLFTDQANVSGQNFNCNLYIIINGKLASETRQVQSRVLKIVKRSFETLMKSSSWNDLFRLYGITKKDNVDFNYVSIPDNYEALSKKMFNHEEMDQLFELGFKMAKTGYKWRKNLPGFDSTKHKELIWTPM
jgi:predicted acylesterase/phospholipase RssA